jgi:hypothetical protein
MDRFCPHTNKKKRIAITDDMAGKKILMGKSGGQKGKPVLANHESTANRTDELKPQKHVWQFKEGVAVKVNAGWSDKVAQ